MGCWWNSGSTRAPAPTKTQAPQTGTWLTRGKATCRGGEGVLGLVLCHAKHNKDLQRHRRPCHLGPTVPNASFTVLLAGMTITVATYHGPGTVLSTSPALAHLSSQPSVRKLLYMFSFDRGGN